MYRNGQVGVMDIFLNADSFDSLVNNWKMFEVLNQSDQDLIQKTKEMREEVEKEKQEYEILEQAAADRIAEAAFSKEKAQELLNEAQTTYDNLSAEIAQIVTAVEEQQAEAKREEIIENAGITIPQSEPNVSLNPQTPQSNYEDQPVSTGNSSIVDRAYGELGKPYVWGAVGPHSYDCSGLVSYCVSGKHVRIGTTGTFMGWTRVSNPQPGDICVNNGHCGIYIGNGQMIHAPQSGDVVKIGPVQAGMIYVRP